MTAGNGLPCVKCGTSEWDKRGSCKECHRDSVRRWQDANPERARKNVRRWNEAHPEKIRASAARYRRSNPEREKDRKDAYRRSNIEKERERSSTWMQNNPDKVKSIQHRRRAKKAGNGGSFTAGEWKALCDHYGNKCLRCGRSSVKLTFDHITPVSKGGTSDISNGQPLCKSCNSGKKDRHTDYRPDAGPLRWMQPSLMSIQRD